MNNYYKSIPSEQMSDFDSFYINMAEHTLPDEANIIELGLSDGRSIIHMASLMKHFKKRCRIWGVDKWDYGASNQLSTLMNNIIRSGEDTITVKCASSLDASTSFEDNFFDLCFVDSSHQREYTKAEIILWIRKVKINGILAGHDYLGIDGVRQAVDELIPNEHLRVVETTYKHGVWWVRKTEELKINYNV